MMEDEFKSEEDLEEEPSQHQELKQLLVCTYCVYETDNIDELDAHIQKHEENNFDDGIIMFKHDRKKIKRFNTEIPCKYRCNVCAYSTSRKSDLTKHLLTHNDVATVYKCSQCPYETKRKNDMPKHMLAHCTNVQMYKCPECPYQTKRKCDLPKHLLCHKPMNSVPLYKCHYCDYATKRKGDLPKHVLNHREKSELKFFECTECDYVTKRKNDLHKHMIVHCDKHLNGVFKCLKCTYATDKVNKFSKHVLSECKYWADPISLEHLMLEDILASVDNEDLHVVVDEDDDDEETGEQIPYDQGYIQIASQVEAAGEKTGVFRINLGEFSVDLEAASSQAEIQE